MKVQDSIQLTLIVGIIVLRFSYNKGLNSIIPAPREWGVASVGNFVFRGIVPLQWVVGAVGSQSGTSSGKPEWDQWAVG